ncbi:LacI family DNA-binding transcriptional regulator [Qiania dongpingensis]|uniref:LacI family DNA-binding transcriptional regulator n=1 Tax=Qiania dongpingensis TaxID=2763669 RepID=A0A7G9G1W8_9FIRM|nr:LacI family DNA-binding transcriptional regulator [Qiania dongpingensis]QNM04800.1 LacI family DNA-binding transcriptional regulator [Qiania dongpingensis]
MKKEHKLKDIAAELGVSPAAVSIVINHRKGVSTETRARISAVLEEYGYSVEKKEEAFSEFRDKASFHRSIRFLKYKNSAILVEENGNFVSSIIDSLEEECRKLGYRLVITSFGPENKEEIYHMVSSDPLDGIVVLGTELEAHDLPIFERLSVPVILVDTPAPGHSLNCVTMNNEEIVEKAMDYFFSLGHRDIGYLHSSMNTGNFSARFQGYQNAVSRLGLSQAEERIYCLTPSMAGAYQEMSRLLDQGADLPPALLADNDMIALGCSRALKDKGFRLPQDYSIVGIDDISFSAICAPPLTSVRVPCKELGAQAVQLLHYKLKNPGTAPAKILVSGELIIRRSAVPTGELKS